ncbi:MAG: hypothetical protein J1E60_07075 [Christensenellaceae bacterium]|nr:hypothetical protein [Christensenellaceae bacterium]
MSLLNLLLDADPKSLTEYPTEKIKLKRLSKVCGSDFIVEIRALTQREIDELPQDAHREHVILKGVTNIEFGDTGLRERLKPESRKTPLTPVEVIQRLFLPGEIARLSSSILDLSGFGDGMLEKIEKN